MSLVDGSADEQGVDVQVVSIHTPFFGYHLDKKEGQALARDVNQEIAATVLSAALDALIVDIAAEHRIALQGSDLRLAAGVS